MHKPVGTLDVNKGESRENIVNDCCCFNELTCCVCFVNFWMPFDDRQLRERSPLCLALRVAREL